MTRARERAGAAAFASNNHTKGSPGVLANDGMQALARLIEGAINRALALDPEALRDLGQLDGKVLLIEIAGRGAPLRLWVQPHAHGLRLLPAHERQPDVTISGTPAVFLNQLARGPVVSQALTLRGDIELGQRFQRILSRLDPDWEEALAPVIGDVGARQVGRAARGLRAWGEQALRALGADATEYLQEEAYVLARRERVAAFLREVDRLRADTDRLEQRIGRLVSRS